MEYTQKFLLSRVDELEDKLKRIEEITNLNGIVPSLQIAMIRGTIHPEPNIHYIYEA